MFGFKSRTPVPEPVQESTIETSCHGEIKQVKKYTYCGREYDSPKELEKAEHTRVGREVWKMIEELLKPHPSSCYWSGDTYSWMRLLRLEEIFRTRLDELYNIFATAVEEKQKITATRAFMENLDADL